MRLIPAVTALTEPYWEGARRGELLVQRCSVCSTLWHPPLPRCPSCHSDAVAWVPVSGRGRVYTYTVVYHATHVAMKDKLPYVSALIQLEEGPRILTNLRNVAEEDVRVDMPVRVLFEPLNDEISLPQFEPDLHQEEYGGSFKKRPGGQAGHGLRL